MIASGMHRATGARLADMDHIRQSVRDILTTRVGTRVMRREYGSLLPELIDQPGNPANQLRLMSATVMALLRWEPRISVSRVALTIDAAGQALVDIDAVKRTGPRAGSPLTLTVQI